jgi:L-aminopeptidase/D-esterase-like protein
VRDAAIQWQVKESLLFQPWSLPVVAETYDGWLNDINGFHIEAEHVFEALERATSGPVAEGNVGGGTGMICYEFKGGIGTSSRRLEAGQGGYTVGVLVQANFGSRPLLRIAGVPVGQELGCDDWRCPSWREPRRREGSIIIVVATDAPLLAHQLERLATRASLGVARTGSISSNGSGDIFIAFSTANPGAASAKDLAQVTMVPNGRLNPVFEATVQATEEAIINALVAAETMTGRDDHRVIALPHEAVEEVTRRHGRLVGNEQESSQR